MPASERMAMQCGGCGYRLDHLASHCCPECGRKFDASDQRTFDIVGQRLRAGKSCIFIAIGCSLYPLFATAAMLAAVAAKIADYEDVRDVAYLMANAMWCGVPFAFAGNVAMLVAAPTIARYARNELWVRWSIAAAVAGCTWIGKFILFLLLLPVLAI